MTRETERPSPPSDLDREAREALSILEAEDPDRLRAVGSYLEELAAWKASTADERVPGGTPGSRPSEDGGGDDDSDGDIDVDYPDDVPERASVTVTEVAGTTYYYFQWRDGDRIESKTVRR